MLCRVSVSIPGLPHSVPGAPFPRCHNPECFSLLASVLGQTLLIWEREPQSPASETHSHVRGAACPGVLPVQGRRSFPSYRPLLPCAANLGSLQPVVAGHTGLWGAGVSEGRGLLSLCVPSASAPERHAPGCSATTAAS